MEEHTPQCKGTMLAVLGIILVLVRRYTTWDIWVVLGALLIIKGVLIVAMHGCSCKTCCTTAPKKKK
jgi:hypothetical protein